MSAFENLEITTFAPSSQVENKDQGMASEIVIIPRVTVQHDISTVIEDVRDGIVTNGWEDAWVSCYHEGKPSVHGKVRIERAPTGVSFEPRDGIEWHGTSTAEFQVACVSLDIPAKPIRLPKHIYTQTDPHRSKKITAFDVSPDGSLYATGHADGSITIAPTGIGPNTTSTARRRSGTPHLSTVLSLKFFPSSTVLLSSSSDLSVRIHDATLSTTTTTTDITTPHHPLNTVRTLQAHTAGVTGTAIVDRGRNILSFGRDGTARLWDVRSGKEIGGRRWRSPRGSPILCGCLDQKWDEIMSDAEGNPLGTAEGRGLSMVPLDGEVETTGKVVFVGLQDGTVRGYELSTRNPLFFSSGVDPSLTGSKVAPIESVSYSAERGLLAAGRRDGLVMVWYLKSEPPSSVGRDVIVAAGAEPVLNDEYNWPPTVTFRRNGASIESLTFSHQLGNDNTVSSSTLPSRSPSLLIGAEDGLFCRISIDAGGKPVLVEEFIGVEAGDGVRAVRSVLVDGQEVGWSACDDGCVRRY